MINICSAISVLAISFVIAVTTNAATFNVTTTNDTLDANPGDGICADAGKACSLRAAIGEANALAGADTILLVPGTFTQTLVAAANEGANSGGDWDITSVITIRGTGEFSCALETSRSLGSATERVMNVRESGDLTLSRVTVRNGRFSGIMTDQTRGAGIDNRGVLALDNVIIRDNQITSEGGDNPFGAGIHSEGTLSLISSTVTANTVTRLGPGGRAFGGGVDATSVNTITLTNGGGGIAAQGNAVIVNLNHVTIAGNSAGGGGGGILSGSGHINMKNSIVAGITGGVAPDVQGRIISDDYNHIENAAGATITGITANNTIGDAQLGPLVEHVGGTVHLPDATSPVVNTIPVGTNDCGVTITSDQRAVRRPQGGGCDKGSVERAVSASIGGRVIIFEGNGIRNATVTLTSPSLPQPLTTQTGSFGWYSFPDLPAERTYTLTVRSKRFEFILPTLGSVYISADAANLDFMAEPR